MRRAVLAYNNSTAYVDEVLDTARRYAEPVAVAHVAGDYALPLPADVLTPEMIARPHHDYPAWDAAVPIGTPVFAVHGGTVISVTYDGRCGLGVILAGRDGARYTYCHASAILVQRGQMVTAGTQLLLSGNTGRSTGPHLHLQIHGIDGSLVCPQPLLLAWRQGHPLKPDTSISCVA